MGATGTQASHQAFGTVGGSEVNKAWGVIK
jgi:hypothetical protein